MLSTGVMPEVKRREIQRRKHRRERLWRGDNNDDGENGIAAGGGDGALKRAARKILVKQLKELREKEAKIKNKKRKGGENDEYDDDALFIPEEERNVAKGTSSNNGALAAGFTLEDESDLPLNDATSSKEQQQSSINNKYKTAEDDNDDEVISINSKDSIYEKAVSINEKATQQQQHQMMGNGDKTTEYESENDWEMSMAVQFSINDSLQQQQQQQRQQSSSYESNSDNNDTYNSTQEDETNNPFEEHEYYATASNAEIANLPTETRHQWIDSQWKKRRIQSRKECIQSCTNPEDYSSTQLKNFLKGSLLTKRVNEIDKLVESRKDGDDDESGCGGFATADSEAISASTGSLQQHLPRPELQRLKRHNNLQSDDEDNVLFDSTSSRSNNRGGGGTSMKVLFGEDESEDEALGGGGFLLPSSTEPTAAKAASSSQMESEKNEVVDLLDVDSDDDVDSQSDDAEGGTKDGAACSVGNNTDHAAAQLSTTQDKVPTLKLLELATAEQEWEQWGGGEASDDAKKSSKEVPTTNSNVASEVNNTTVMDQASESESDDGGQNDTFLMFGQAATKVYTSDVIEIANDATSSRNNKDSVKENNTSDTEEDDNGEDDEVDWEDGDSGNGADDVIDISRNSLENGEADEANTSNGNSMECVEEESSEQVEASILTNTEADKIQQKPSTNVKDVATSKKLHVENIATEQLPSDDYTNKREHEDTAKSNQLKSNPEPNDSKQVPLTIDSSDEESSNEFEAYRSNDPQAAALLRAQDTASRLTSWAGRAFERAISAHTTQQAQSDSPNHERQSEKEHIDLTVGDDDAIDVDDSDMVAAKTNGPVNSKAADTSNSSPTRQQKNNHVLFDTSLEGLTEAHNAILQEEKTMERDMSTITDEMKDDILKLLQLCGIPWIESPSEAEAQCAALEELGLVDGVVTEDSDIFVFGGPNNKVYKNFFNENKYVEAYYAKDLQGSLGLKKHQLVALAMLLGGDYTDGVKGVGIVNGMEILQAFTIGDSADGIKKGLSAFREWLDGIDDASSSSSQKEVAVFHKKHKSARTRWVAPSDFPSEGIINAYLKPAVDKSDTRFSWAKPDLTGLQYYCAETLGWEQAETDRVVNPVLKVIEEGSKQTRLENYFMRYEDNQVAGKVKSKRLQAALLKIEGEEDGNDIESADVNEDIDSGISDKVGESDNIKRPKRKRQRRKKSQSN